MEIIRAAAMGMCFGVRDAIDAARDLENPGEVTIHGELVHNEAVTRELRERGFQESPEAARGYPPVTRQVLVTAHGVSDVERHRLREAGKELIDTTCPLVRRAHEAALRLAGEGRFVVIVGRRGHVEVEGLVGDLPRCEVVHGPDEVRAWPHARIGVIAQTTSRLTDVDAVVRTVRERNPEADVVRVDTVCQPTKDRQHSLEELVGQVDAVVVVGGENSNNTRQLALRCQARGRPAYHVQCPGDLRSEWFTGCDRVGLTAGTSTLAETVDAVHRGLLRIAAAVAS